MDGNLRITLASLPQRGWNVASAVAAQRGHFARGDLDAQAEHGAISEQISAGRCGRANGAAEEPDDDEARKSGRGENASGLRPRFSLSARHHFCGFWVSTSALAPGRSWPSEGLFMTLPKTHIVAEP